MARRPSTRTVHRETVSRLALTHLAELVPNMAVAFTADKGWHLIACGDLETLTAAGDRADDAITLDELAQRRAALTEPSTAHGRRCTCPTCRPAQAVS